MPQSLLSQARASLRLPHAVMVHDVHHTQLNDTVHWGMSTAMTIHAAFLQNAPPANRNDAVDWRMSTAVTRHAALLHKALRCNAKQCEGEQYSHVHGDADSSGFFYSASTSSFPGNQSVRA